MNACHNPSPLAPKLLHTLHRALSSLHYCVELGPGFGINEERLNNSVAAWTRWHDTPAAFIFPERLTTLVGGADNLIVLIDQLDDSALLPSSGGPSPYLHMIPFTVWVNQSRSYVLRRDCLVVDLDTLDALTRAAPPFGTAAQPVCG